MGPCSVCSNEKAGQNTRLRIQGGAELELKVAVGSVELVNYRIIDSKSLEQLKIRCTRFGSREPWYRPARVPEEVSVAA